jgi:hypothetical protein
MKLKAIITYAVICILVDKYNLVESVVEADAYQMQTETTTEETIVTHTLLPTAQPLCPDRVCPVIDCVGVILCKPCLYADPCKCPCCPTCSKKGFTVHPTPED